MKDYDYDDGDGGDSSDDATPMMMTIATTLMMVILALIYWYFRLNAKRFHKSFSPKGHGQILFKEVYNLRVKMVVWTRSIFEYTKLFNLA